MVNPPSDNFVGVDHSWHHDVHNITEADIRDLGRDKMVLFSFGSSLQSNFPRQTVCIRQHSLSSRKVKAMKQCVILSPNYQSRSKIG